MNNQDFTAFCLANIEKEIICIKAKPLFVDHKDYGTFYEFNEGDKLTIKGFICCTDEQQLILESKKDSEESINYCDFLEYFETAH